MATDWNCRGGERELGTGLELWPSLLARFEGATGRDLPEVAARSASRRGGAYLRPPSSGPSLRASGRARRSPHSGSWVLASRTCPLFLLSSLGAHRQWMATPCSQYQGKTRFPRCQTQCPLNSVIWCTSLTNLPWGRLGLHGVHAEQTVDSVLGIKPGPSCARSSW